MADTKITRLRNLLTPMKNYIAMVNADKRGESISTLLLDRELDRINKYSDEIWTIIAEIPNDACDGECSHESSGLHLQRVMPMLLKIAETIDNAVENTNPDDDITFGKISDVVELLGKIYEDNHMLKCN